MAKITDFLSQVLPFVPGCPEPVAVQHIRQVCIDFCQVAQVWQQTLDPISTLQNVGVYDIVPPNQADITMVKRAWYKGVEIKIINGDSREVKPELYNNAFPDARNAVADPKVLLVDHESKTCRVDPLPRESVSNAITIRAALKPSRSAQSIPDFLLLDYEYAISQGAVSRIADLPAQPFSNPAISLAARSIYLSERHNAAVRSNKSFSRSQAIVAQRPFA